MGAQTSRNTEYDYSRGSTPLNLETVKQQHRNAQQRRSPQAQQRFQAGNMQAAVTVTTQQYAAPQVVIETTEPMTVQHRSANQLMIPNATVADATSPRSPVQVVEVQPATKYTYNSKYAIGIPLISCAFIGAGVYYGMRYGQRHSKDVQAEIDEIIAVNKNAKTFQQMHPSQIRFPPAEQLPEKPISEADRVYALRRTLHAMNIATALLVGATLLGTAIVKYRYDIHTLDELVNRLNAYTQSTHTSDDSAMKRYVQHRATAFTGWFNTTRLSQSLKKNEPNTDELQRDEQELYTTFDTANVLQQIRDEHEQSRRSNQ